MTKLNHKTKRVRKGSHRVAANHHRQVHKGISYGVICIWIAVAVFTAVLIGSYLDSRRHVYINRNGITLKADNLTYDDVGKYPFLPGKGYEFVIVHVSVTNNTNGYFDFAPVLQTYLKDGKGKQYNMAPADLKDPIQAGKISPGETRSGSLSYVVPVNSNQLSFHFDLE